VLHALARARPRRGLATVLEREPTLPFLPVLGGLLALLVVGFGVSYRSLLPLADGESPDALVVVLPLVAVGLLALMLTGSSRHGHEIGINFVFAAGGAAVRHPAGLASVALGASTESASACSRCRCSSRWLWSSLRCPALLRSAGAFGLLVLGWKPVLDRIVSLVAEPLGTSTPRSWECASPFAAHAHRTGQLFVVGPNGERSIGVSSACAGLSALLSMLSSGRSGPMVRGTRQAAPLARCGRRPRSRRERVRMTVIVVVADRVGLGARRASSAPQASRSSRACSS
jgi:hypothetical protein